MRRSQNTVHYVEVNPPRLGQDFDTCGSNSFLWGPRHDYDVVAWSPDGSELYFTDGGDVRGVSVDGWRLWQIARAWPPEAEGKLRSETGWTSFAVAPGGLQLVYVACVAETAETARPPDRPPHVRLVGPVDTDKDFHYDLIRVANDGTDSERLTVSGAIEFYPAWSPDGQRIALLTDAGRYDPERFYWHPGLGLNTMAPDGTDVRQVLGKDFQVLHQPPQWSPDSRHLAVVLYQPDTYHDLRGRLGDRSLHRVGVDGGEPQRLARGVVSGPSWSPDGQWLAYAQATVEPGVALYTIRVDGTDARRIADISNWRVPQGYDVIPSEAWIDTVAWSPDGTRILVRSDAGSAAFVATIASGEITELPLDSVRAAAWSPDGSRIGLIAGWYGEASPQVVATIAADGTDLRVLAEQSDGDAAGSELVAERGRYVPGPEDEAACRIGGAVPDPDSNDRLVKQCVDLIRVQKSLVGGEALNWSPERPMAEWDGVVLAGTPRVVRELDLGSRGLRGALREAIPWTAALRVLVLRDNNLDGPIPDGTLNQWRLEVVDLSNNQLTGPIPFRLGELDRLRVLDLSSNQLSGEIPPALADPSNLQEIALAGNRFTGCVPPGLPLRDREELDLPACEPGS